MIIIVLYFEICSLNWIILEQRKTQLKWSYMNKTKNSRTVSVVWILLYVMYLRKQSISWHYSVFHNAEEENN